MHDMNSEELRLHLASDRVIDWRFPAVHDLASRLAGVTVEDTVRQCFEWVRDRIRHSVDGADTRLTCAASEVLRHGTGLCYAKSHLLVALLRANGIPAGLCYQRLRMSPGALGLHGLAAVFLPDHRWYRMDARGNRPGQAAAGFAPPTELLPFSACEPGEQDSRTVHATALPTVVEALRSHPNVAALMASGWPDLPGLP